MQNAEILGAFYENFCMKRFSDAMASMNLSDHKTYKAMSRGERLRFQLAFAMAYEPCLRSHDQPHLLGDREQDGLCGRYGKRLSGDVRGESGYHSETKTLVLHPARNWSTKEGG